MNSNHNQVIGLDVGRAHIGVARASSLARLAEPLSTIDGSNWDELTELIKKLRPEAIVVGLPRGLDGQDTEQTKWTRQWLEQAKLKFEVPLYWQDEALTSQAAHSHTKADEHAHAAAAILQDWLDNSKPLGHRVDSARSGR